MKRLTEDEKIERESRLLHDAGRRKGRAERLSGVGMFEHQLDDPRAEAARVSGWREADLRPWNYDLQTEIAALKASVAKARKAIR